MCVDNIFESTNEFNDEQKGALRVLEDESFPYILLTGDAGTGKSTVIKEYIKRVREKDKKVIVSASTGFAASIINGVTYYKAFGIRPGDENNVRDIGIPNDLCETDVIIIDEVSMITAEMFDLLFQELQFIKNKKGKTIKMILVGDFFQLPPVEKKLYVNVHWLFEADSFKNFKCIRLITKMRSSEDNEFAQMLDLAKVGDEKCLDYINLKSKKEKFTNETYICGKKTDADSICKKRLSQLDGDYINIVGRFLDEFNSIIAKKGENSQLEEKLILKKGAKIRFTVNDLERRFANGTEGILIRIDMNDKQEAKKLIIRRLDNNELIELDRVCLPLDDGVGKIEQFPIRLSYAITIHKSQGMTFEKINILPAGWEPGQLYVALSRAKSIEGIYLADKVEADMLKCDPRVIKFYKETEFIN